MLANTSDIGVTLPPRTSRLRHPLWDIRRVTNIFGDPTKAELFVQQVKFPADFKLLLHWHSEEARTIVILSGTLY